MKEMKPAAWTEYFLPDARCPIHVTWCKLHDVESSKLRPLRFTIVKIVLNTILEPLIHLRQIADC